MSMTHYSPYYEHSMYGVVRQAMDELMHHRHFPFWGHIPHLQSLHYGSPVGEIVNTAEKYGFALDISHFNPDEVKVSVNGNVLTIEGKHEEKDDGHGTVERSFTRKYTLPKDVNLDSVRSVIDKDGHLAIEATKKTPELTQSRAIPITVVSPKPSPDYSHIPPYTQNHIPNILLRSNIVFLHQCTCSNKLI